jgi:hypothetical protein
MKFDAAIDQAVKQGAIRVFRLSDSTAYVYRFQDGKYQARTLSGDAESSEWTFVDALVGSEKRLSPDGWHQVLGLPHVAKAIETEAAMENPGYGQAAMRQCYTCKENKPEEAFKRASEGQYTERNWECNQCYEQRMREVGAYQRGGERREGDYLDKETVASPPPPEGKI